MTVEGIPHELKTRGLFCLWRYEERDGKKTKVPYKTDGHRAASNKPETFTAFDKALAVYRKGGYNGLGLGIFNGFCAVDIDHCIDNDAPGGSAISAMAQDIIETMDSYTELSPSGTGIRILFRAEGFRYDKSRFYVNNQARGLEVYIEGSTNKYVTVTGMHCGKWGQKPIAERGAQIAQVLDKYMRREKKAKQPDASPSSTATSYPLLDFELIDRIRQSKAGKAFAALWDGDTSGYPSASEADMALCNILAFWTRKDAARMDGLFRQSGLMRDKWDRPQSGSTYGALTVQRAIEDCTAVYDPQAAMERRALAVGVRRPPGTAAGGTPVLADLQPEKNDRYGWNDMGNGYLFADWYKEKVRFVPEAKTWFIYNGKVWERDVGGLRAMHLCKELADALHIYALSIEDEKQRISYSEATSKWQRRAYRETVLKDAADVYPASLSEFDRDPHLLNCQNGTLDLRNRAFRPHDPRDMLTMIANVDYDPEARCERWERFIEEIMQGDQEKAVFLQKAMGYALTGDTRHECLFFFYGPTSRNGKSTTIEPIMHMMGDYGKTAKPDTIALKQNPDGRGPSEDVARLAGARFVNIPEPPKNMMLSAALVKTMTGGDTVTARFLNENSFQYRPQFKLFINTNHLPSVTDTTLFSSGRVKIIPFEKHFTEQERDEGLKELFLQPENQSAILNWCLEGLCLLRETGLNMPESVRAATEDYRQSSDKTGRFLEEEMEADPLAETKTSETYTRYQEWCGRNGYKAENMQNFKSNLANLAVIRRKRPEGGGRDSSPTTFLLGFRLRENPCDFYSV